MFALVQTRPVNEPQYFVAKLTVPGMGGVFNVVNLHLYHYAGNNPVKYNDPTGRISMPASADFEEAMSIATVGVGVALPAAPAIPYFKEGLAMLGKALPVIGIVVFVGLLQGDVAKSSAK